MTILETGAGRISLTGDPEPREVFSGGSVTGWRQEAGILRGNRIVRTQVDIRGFREIHWPNREGESFSPGAAASALGGLDLRERGLSLCWPATASLQGLGVRDGSDLYLLRAVPSGEGRTRFLSLESADPEGVRFVFTGEPVEWRLLRSTGRPDPVNRAAKPPAAMLWQLGLIDPEGRSRVPASRGFDILIDAADRIAALETGETDRRNILHVFGYAAGHDRGYPDYRPAAELGGITGLRRAVAEVMERGVEVSLYMNARLADRKDLDSDSGLAGAVMRDDSGEPVTEVYRGVEFAVMDPENRTWRDRLILEAGLLASTGAEWIQLDQVAGRAAPTNPGEPWGDGYRKLITDLQHLGTKVWIQGVCDHYPADAFEATWRPVTVLEDGTLRGGTPFGRADTSLLEAAGFNGSLIVPAAKAGDLAGCGLPVIRDANARRDVLPLWNDDWPGEIPGINEENNSRDAGENGGSI